MMSCYVSSSKVVVAQKKEQNCDCRRGGGRTFFLHHHHHQQQQQHRSRMRNFTRKRTTLNAADAAAGKKEENGVDDGDDDETFSSSSKARISEIVSVVDTQKGRPKQSGLLDSETQKNLTKGEDDAFCEKKEVTRFETFLITTTTATTTINSPEEKYDDLRETKEEERRESNSFYASLEADQTAFLDSYSPPTAFDEMILQNKSMESKGTLTGVVALITGSTVGAGILALPSVCAETGVVPSILGIVGTWTLLLLSALLLAEINVSVMRERDEVRFEHGRGHSPVVISLPDMAMTTLGKTGSYVMSATYLFASTTLLVAYIAKAGEIIETIDPALTLEASTIGFTVGLGAVMAFGSVNVIDIINRVLTIVLMGLFFGILYEGAIVADFKNYDLINDASKLPEAIPIMFLSLIYHDLVPVICAYMNGDLKEIRKAIVVGSCVPLFMFIAYLIVALSINNTSVASGLGFEDPLDLLLKSDVGWIVGGFSFCAISTSFIGTCLGVTSTIEPKIKESFAEKGVTAKGAKKVSYFATLILPLIIALSASDIFLPATKFAGSYGAPVLYGLLPSVMCFIWFTSEERNSFHNVGMEYGTKIPIKALVFLASFAIMADRFLQDTGLLSFSSVSS